jgi:hypothetical protein
MNAAGGALFGSMLGYARRQRIEHMLVGAAVGGFSGALFGSYMLRKDLEMLKFPCLDLYSDYEPVKKRIIRRKLRVVKAGSYVNRLPRVGCSYCGRLLDNNQMSCSGCGAPRCV